MPKFVVTDRAGQVVEIDARNGISVMENIRDLDNSVDAICGGLCACATCHVFVAADWVARLADRSGEENALLEGLPSFDSQRSRLSCQIIVDDELDGLELTVGPENF